MEESLAMEEALPQEADQVKKGNHFAVAIAASLLLHAVCSIVLIGLPGGPPSRPSVTYIDLSLPQQQAMALPAQVPEPQASPLPEPQAEPIPEKETAAQEPPAQAQQAQAVPDPPAAPPQERKEKQSHTTLGLGLTKGYFKSIGEGETLRAGVKEYYLEMLQGINEKWWLDQQLDKQRLRPIIVNLTIARNGDIVGSQILATSGNPRYDRAVLTALNSAGPLPPLPRDYVGDTFEAPIRLVPPLNLMIW